MTGMQRLDEQARQEALTPGINVLVEAGAGTGKTTLLVNRALTALLEEGVPPARLVLITFMEKAADEILQRLQKRLTEAMTGPDGRIRQRAEAALTDLRHSAITTIHGFCHGIVTRHGLGRGLPLTFRVLSPYEADRFWEDVFRQWLDRVPEAAETAWGLVEAGVPLRHLVTWARDLTRWPDWPELPSVTVDYQGFLDRTRQEAEHYRTVAQNEADAQDGGRQQIERIYQEIEAMTTRSWEQWPRRIAYWTVDAPKGNQKNWRHGDRLKEQKAWITQLREELNRLRQRMADQWLARWANTVRQSLRPLWRERRFAAQALTYDDLLYEAQRLVHDPEVQASEYARYDLILVDEFQDTDPVQSDLILRLATAPGAAPGRLTPGRLFLVGDPKQSIYRFRGADVEAYTDVRRQLTRVIPIVQNFRSQPDILDYVNRQFLDRWPAEPDPAVPYVPPYQPLQPAIEADNRPHVWELTREACRTVDECRRAEAERIAEMLLTAKRERWPVRDGHGGERPLEWGDVAIVVPARTGIDIYRQVLTAHGIPVAPSAGRGFFRRDEVRGFQCLCQALADPWNPVWWVGFLTSPWVGFSLERLARHRLLGGTWDLWDPGDGGDPTVRQWMERLRHQAEYRWFDAPETLLDWALETTGYAEALRHRPDPVALANLGKLRDLARELGDRWGMAEFARWLTDQVTRQIPEDEAPLPTVGEQVVFSTVHQAKGLEWPLVVVANWRKGSTKLGSGLHYDPRTGLLALKTEQWQSSDYETMNVRHEAREEAEADRLRYVALTRARDYLMVFDPLS